MDKESAEAFGLVNDRLDRLNERVDRLMEVLDSATEGAACEPSHAVSEDFLWDLVHERNYRQLLARMKVAVEELQAMGVWVVPSGPGDDEDYEEEEDEDSLV